MIGWLVTAVRDLVLAPQATVLPEERRAVLDVDAAPVDTAGTSLEIVSEGTRILRVEIGGRSFELRHTITWELTVRHGDAAEAARLRDEITTDLVLRLVDALPEIGGLTDPVSGQYVSGPIEFSLGYTDPAGGDTPNAFTTATLTVDTQLDR